MRHTFALLIGLQILLVPCASFAQEEIVAQTTQLESLLEQLSNSPSNEYLQTRIESTKQDIQNIHEENLQILIQDTSKKSQEATTDGTIVSPIDRQQKIVLVLTEQIGEIQADLALLSAEEKAYYSGASGTLLPSTVGTKITKNKFDLGAQQINLSLQQEVFQSSLLTQQARLASMKRQQTLDQFSSLIALGKYAFLLLLVYLFHSIIQSRILSKIENDSARYRYTKMFSWVIYALVTLWFLSLIAIGNSNIVASFAIVGAGLAIALQDIVKDIVGWMLILRNKLFSRGDRITVGDISGDVVDITLLRTALLEVGVPNKDGTSIDTLERTGKLLSVPNAAFLSQPITNQSKTSKYIRSELHIMVTFESNWEKTEEILLNLLNEHTADYATQDIKQTRERGRELYFIPQKTSGNQVYTHIAADGVDFTLRFTIPIGERRPIVSKLSKDILREFAKHDDIDLAYRTIRSYEGTKALGTKF